MMQLENIAGGRTFVLSVEDSLDDVPQSHVDMLTPQVRRVFDDPIGWLKSMIGQTGILTFDEWIQRSVESNRWHLCLHEGYLPNRVTLAAFSVNPMNSRGASLSLPAKTQKRSLPPTLNRFYRVVGCVRWEEFGYGGGINAEDDFWEIDKELTCSNEQEINLSSWFCWGHSSCGDMLIGSDDDRAAYLSLENGKLDRVGSTFEMLSWVFESLLNGETPEFRY